MCKAVIYIVWIYLSVILVWVFWEDGGGGVWGFVLFVCLRVGVLFFFLSSGPIPIYVCELQIFC